MLILGQTEVALIDAIAWAQSVGAHQRFLDVAPLYWQIAPRYNVPAELAYVQAGKETAHGHYTGVLTPDFHNWCGLKTEAGGGNYDPNAHQRFINDYNGVLAHIQHLAKYGGQSVPVADDALLDPRAKYVKLGIAPNVADLGGKWAPSLTYGTELEERLNQIRRFARENGSNMVAQIPGFSWFPADTNHFSRGRTAKIRGGAQHYTGGTNSLNWLTSTSGVNNPDERVSSTFLIKHNPTIEDRGWQLVRIEDTAWTTAYANPYTVSIEYEQLAGQDIPDIAYYVMARTWIAIANYVRENNLGEIPFVRVRNTNQSGIGGHKDWINSPNYICPDGINIDRILDDIHTILASEQHLEESVKPERITFDETGKTLAGGFLRYWEENGGLRIFGFPITDELTENGRTVQYFERARFEHHPGSNATYYDVMLGLIGKELLEARES